MVISVISTGIGGLVDTFMWGVITPQWCRCSLGGDIKIMGGDGAFFPKMGGDHPPSPPTTKNPGVRSLTQGKIGCFGSSINSLSV